MSYARHIHLDPLGGLAGDMFIAAILHAYPKLADGTFAAMRTAGLPPGWRAEVMDHDDGVLAGRRVVIEGGAGAPPRPGRSFDELVALLETAPLAGLVRERALAIVRLLGEAEAAVHGTGLEGVHFHELGDWDSLADVVGATFLIEALAPCTYSCAPLPTGSGRVSTQHGALPVPAPATVKLLEGMAVIDDGIGGERVTPTGAAILRHLAPAPHLPHGSWLLKGTGCGFGARKLAGISNVLRVLVFEAEQLERIDERVTVITFEVDDQTPEDLAVALDRLRAAEGVLDVVQMPALGKKGRMGAHLQVLVRPQKLESVIERCFTETTTIGLRWRVEARAVLARERVQAGGSDVKLVERPGRRSAKAEIEQVRDVGGHSERAARRAAAEARALAERDERKQG